MFLSWDFRREVYSNFLWVKVLMILYTGDCLKEVVELVVVFFKVWNF